MLYSRRYLCFLASGAVLSGWAGSLIHSRGARPGDARIEKQEAKLVAERGQLQARPAERDFATLMRDIIREFPKSPENATHFEAWDQIRGFSLKQVMEGLQIAGDPLQEDPPNMVACMLLARWAELEPEAALQSLAASKSNNKQGLVLSLIGAWVQRDPDGATRWAQAHPEEIEISRIHRMRAATLLEKPVAAALAEARGMPDEVRRHVVSILARSMLESDEDRARCFKLLEAMEDGDRSHAAATMAETMTRRSAREGLDLLETLPMSEEAREKARSRAVQAYTTQKPAEALVWLESQPKLGSIQDRGKALNSWSGQDAAAAEVWLDRQPNAAPILAAALDVGKLTLLSGHAHESVRANQGKSMRSYFTRWQNLDAEAAARWLENVPPDVAAYLVPEGHADE